MSSGRTIAAGIAVLLIPLGMLAQTKQAIAGSIKNVTGEVVIRRAATRIPAQAGLHILPHDVVETGAGASLGLILQDGTRVAVGANTLLDIDTFLYEPAASKLSLVIRLLRGAMVYISGKMAELSPESVKLETPVGVVALRGTQVGISLVER